LEAPEDENLDVVVFLPMVEASLKTQADAALQRFKASNPSGKWRYPLVREH